MTSLTENPKLGDAKERVQRHARGGTARAEAAGRRRAAMVAEGRRRAAACVQRHHRGLLQFQHPELVVGVHHLAVRNTLAHRLGAQVDARSQPWVST